MTNYVHEPLTNNIICNISSRFSSNSEAFASELLENLEELFRRNWIDGDVITRFKPSPSHNASHILELLPHKFKIHRQYISDNV